MDKNLKDINVQIADDNPSIRHIDSMCIKCGKCREVCTNELSVCGSFDPLLTKDKPICVNCGQCRNVCPKHALIERKAWLDVNDHIKRKDKKIIFMTSPAVRVAIGEEFGITSGTNCSKKMVGALKQLGADFVFDVTFGADLTIMEEASELVDRITNKKPLPMFTSCCPAWVKFCEIYYPKLLPNISTCKSPISMQASIIKTYFAKKQNLKAQDIILVAITPCTAKKAEILRPELSAANSFFKEKNIRDCDYVITTRELAEWIKAKNLDLNIVKEADYDSFFPTGSGAGLIFGNSGGVMEAALRTAYYLLENKDTPENFLQFEKVRGLGEIKEATVQIGKLTLNVAVVHGLKNVRTFLSLIKTAKKQYHFVEVMTCRGGCIGGGGQPKHPAPINDELRTKRINGLYSADALSKIKCSHNNINVKKLYDEFLDKPLSQLSEKLLHTKYESKEDLLNESADKYEINKIAEKSTEEEKAEYKCLLCGYVYYGNIEKEKDDYVCPKCFAPKTLFEKTEG